MIENTTFEKWLYAYASTVGTTCVKSKVNEDNNPQFIGMELLTYANMSKIEAGYIQGKPSSYAAPAGTTHNKFPTVTDRKYALIFSEVPGTAKDRYDVSTRLGAVTKAASDYIKSEFMGCIDQTFYMIMFGFLNPTDMKTLVFYKKLVNGVITEQCLNLNLVKMGLARFTPIKTAIYISPDGKASNGKYDRHDTNGVVVNKIYGDFSNAQIDAIQASYSLPDNAVNIWKALKSVDALGGLSALEMANKNIDSKIKIASLNVRDFDATNVGDSSNSKKDIVDFITQHDLDVFISMESNKDIMSDILATLNKVTKHKYEPIGYAMADKTTEDKSRIDALTILSRYPMTFSSIPASSNVVDPVTQQQYANNEARPMLRANINIRGQEFIFFVVHLKSGVGSPRDVASNHPTFGNMHIRRGQAKAFYDFIAPIINDPTKNVIICGDFNTTNKELEVDLVNGHFSPMSPMYYLTGEHEELGKFNYLNKQAGPTFKTGNSVLDHMFISTKVYVGSMFNPQDNTKPVGFLPVSDHNPIMLTLTIPINVVATEQTKTITDSDITAIYNQELKQDGYFKYADFHIGGNQELANIARAKYKTAGLVGDHIFAIINTNSGWSEPIGLTMGMPALVTDYSSQVNTIMLRLTQTITAMGSDGHSVTGITICKMMGSNIANAQDMQKAQLSNNADRLLYEEIIKNYNYLTDANITMLVATFQTVCQFTYTNIYFSSPAGKEYTSIESIADYMITQGLV